MRFHYASIRRAEQAAAGFLRVLRERGHAATLTQARLVVAKATGHASWHEMSLSLGRSPEPSAFDERLDLADARLRLRRQADAIAGALGVPVGEACLLAASARLTAHPAGPHKVAGPSSAPIASPVMRPHQLEYRGTHPDLGPLAFVDGDLRPYLSVDTLRAALDLRGRMLEGRRTGHGTLWSGIFTRIFLPDPIGEMKAYDELVTGLHRMAWRDLYGLIESGPHVPGDALHGPAFEPRLVAA